MTSKERVLAIHPDAIAEEINKGSRRLPARWIIYCQSKDRILTGHAKGSEENAWKSAARVAWQNAAESLPAVPEQDEESLLPCPFCGGTARWGESPDSGHFIECSKCQSSTNLTYYLMDDASRDVRERWNRRVK